MSQPVPKEVDAFFLQGNNDAGVLLVHGYTGSPAEMRLLGNYLNEKGGYTVLGVRLAGHGTTVEELEQTVWQDWYKAVDEGVKELHKTCDHIYVAGQSMGGLLAIKAAAEFSAQNIFAVRAEQNNASSSAEKELRDSSQKKSAGAPLIEKAALLATPIYLKDKRVPFVKILRFLIRRIHTGQQTYDVPREYMQGYPEMPTKPIPSLLELIKLCKEDYLKKITAPTLIVQGEADHTVNPKSANYIYENLSNVPKQQKKILWLPKSRHVVTLGEEREKVFAACLEFFTKDLEETS